MPDVPSGPSPAGPEHDPAFLTRLLESLPYPVSYVDADLVYRHCNAAAAASVGLTPDQVVGKPVASVVRADSQVVSLLRRVLESGEPYSGTLDFTPPGSARTSRYRVSCVPDSDGDGRTVGAAINVVDVTELSESEERFHTLFRSMNEGVALHELVYEGGKAVDYRILDVNPAYEAQTGIAAEAAQGRLASAVYGTGEAPYLAEYAAVAESGHSISFEVYFAPLERHFRIGVVRPAPGRFATIFEDVTERRRVAEALRESEERFVAVFERSPFALALSKMPGLRLVAVNAAFEALFGFERGELLGKASPDLGVADPASQAQVRELLEQHGYCHDFVCRRRTKSGEEIWVSLSVDKLVLDGEEYLLTTVQDVDERKRAEGALREGEERYRLLHDTMLQGVVYQDADGTIISMNPAAERILGKRREDFLGSSSMGVEHDTLREDGTPFPGLEHPAMVALRTGETVPDVLMQVYNPQEAGYRLISIQAVPLVRPGEDRPYRVYTVFDDVTERKQAQEALRRHAEMLDLSFDAIIVWQLGGTIESWNRGAEDLYGFSKDEALGRVSHDLLTSIHQRPWLEIEATLRELGNWEGEVRHHAKDGHELVVSSRHQLFRGRDGVDRVVETNRDVTEAVHAEQRMLDQLATTQALLEAAIATAAFDLDTVLGRLVDIVALQLGRSRVVIHLFEGEREVRTLAATDLRVLQRGQIQPFDDYSAELQHAATARMPTIVDYTRDGISEQAARERERLQVELVLYVPVMLKDRLLGVMTIDEPHAYLAFSPRDVELAAALASQAAVAVENARLYEAETAAQMERAAQEERTRLARDLHDSVTQALFAATLKAEALTLAGDSLPEGMSRTAEDVRRLSRGALAEMRTLLLELRGVAPADVPVAQLLRHLVEAAEGRSGVNVRLAVRGDGPSPPALHAPVYRIAQEALNNVTRHARASEAWVELDLEPGRVRLVVGDDGCGFDRSAPGPAHMGLRTMRERAEEARARFGVVTEPGAGTVITVDWPADAAG